jgi:hypothetical protein
MTPLSALRTVAILLLPSDFMSLYLSYRSTGSFLEADFVGLLLCNSITIRQTCQVAQNAAVTARAVWLATAATRNDPKTCNLLRAW